MVVLISEKIKQLVTHPDNKMYNHLIESRNTKLPVTILQMISLNEFTTNCWDGNVTEIKWRNHSTINQVSIVLVLKF